MFMGVRIYMDFEKILYYHARKYPLSEPCDAVKLAYQSEFGAGHLIINEENARARFFEELSLTSQCPSVELEEEIGGGLVRLNFAAFSKNRVNPSLAFMAFLNTARIVKGSIDGFLKKAEIIKNAGCYSFTKLELDEYLNSYLKNLTDGEMPYPVSHSIVYKRAYSPSYRIVAKELLGGIKEEKCQKFS